ncbi:hypothetical protein BGY98DRAFT_950521 [Russula aff. rugulosa BPL654]|nr:hypothetical protein BGY98DRAFT_950521 [Russula aff. rugulosa BPL654]
MQNSLVVWALRMTTTGASHVAPTIHGLQGYVVMPSGLSSVHRHPAFYGRWFCRSIKDTKGVAEQR